MFDPCVASCSLRWILGVPALVLLVVLLLKRNRLHNEVDRTNLASH
jgi:hypothetical protein